MKRYIVVLALCTMAAAASAQNIMAGDGISLCYVYNVKSIDFYGDFIVIDGGRYHAPAKWVYLYPDGTLIPGDFFSLEFTPEASSHTVGYICPDVWVATELPRGFKLDRTYGEIGYHEITISVDENPGSEVNEGTLRLIGGSGEITSIHLRQPGAIEPEVKEEAPRIGDFYYSDGTWSTTLDPARTPIGIVFRVGCATDDGDNAGYYRQKDGTTRFDDVRGYVVALRDATDEGCWWSSFNDDQGCGCSTSTDDFRGYTNTRSIMATAAAKGGLTSDPASFPACYYATTGYETVCPAPAQSSGWYLPSAYQLSYIWNRVWFDEDGSDRACLERSFAQLGDAATPLYRNDAEYWTSTEQVNSYGNSNYAYYFDFSANNFYNGTISHYRKNTNMLVRSVLTF